MILSFLLLPAAVFLTGCEPSERSFAKQDFALDTIISVTVYDTDEAHAMRALDDALSLCAHYDALFSVSDPSGDIYQLNHAGGGIRTVDPDTYELLSAAIGYAKDSGGLLDVTIEPLYELWDFSAPTHDALPTEDDIEAARAKVDYRSIRLLPDSKVRLDNGATLNLGALAKGYIADRMKEELIRDGISSAIINLGGNVLTIGTKPDGSPFRIGLQKPFGATGEVITDVSSSDSSVVTSGNYQRYFEYEGRIMHHILDPTTGYPADTGLNAVTIQTDSSLDADAFSTVCMLLGYEKSLEWLSDHKNVTAVFIDSNNNILTGP